MLHLVVLLLSIALVDIIHADETPFFKTNPIPNNPGIYYEHTGKVKLIKNKFYINLFMNCPALNRNLDDEYFDARQLIHKASEHFPTQIATTTFAEHRLLNKIREISSLQASILTYFVTPSADYIKATLTARKTRSAPLEVIGWATNYFFGIMDSRDKEIITKDIDKLYWNQKNLSQILLEETHFVKLELEKLHTTDNRLALEMKNLLATMQNISKTNTLNENYINYLNISLWWTKYESEIDNLKYGYQTLLEVIQTTAKGHFHPLLLSHSQLADLLNKINHLNSEYVLPKATDLVTPEYLFDIAKTSVFITNGKLHVSLKIPLLNSEELDIYKIHSFPNPSYLFDKIGFISITPKTDNIIISKNLKTYILASDKFLHNCKLYNDTKLCEDFLPLRDETPNSPCEFKMFKHPSVESIKTCETMFIPKTPIIWTSLHSSNLWLYSTTNPVDLAVTCYNRPRRDLKINGTGSLSLSGMCSAHALEFTLHGLNKIFFNSDYTYDPALSVNLDIAKPNLEEYTKYSPAEIKSELTESLPTFDPIPLNEIENRLRTIHTRRSELKRTYTMFGVGFTSSIIIAIFLKYAIDKYFQIEKLWSVLSFICMNKRKNQRKIHKSKNSTNKIHRQGDHHQCDTHSDDNKDDIELSLENALENPAPSQRKPTNPAKITNDQPLWDNSASSSKLNTADP